MTPALVPAARRPLLPWLLAAALLLSVGPLRADDDDGSAPSPVTVVDQDTLRVDGGALANLVLSVVKREPCPDTLAILGTISPIENRVSSVPARAAGRIDSVLKVSGEYVRVGDALALEYSPDYIQTRQEYLDARAAGLSDYSDLAASSRQKLLNMGLSGADIARLGKPGDDPTHLVIRAAHAGAITSVDASVGNMQSQGDNLMTIAELDKVWFIGDLYSEDLTKVHSGQEIRIQTDGLSRPLEGRISFISPVIDSSAHTIKVRAVIQNPDRVLRSGLVVEGDVVLSRNPALVAPLSALMNLHGAWYCFKRVGPNLFREVPVTEGREFGDSATVLSGLSEGDQVVSGGDLVLDNAFSGNQIP